MIGIISILVVIIEQKYTMIKIISNLLSPFCIINAKERIDTLYFSNYNDSEDYHYGTVTCSNCNEKITFHIGDLRKHMMTESTNLSPEDSNKMNKAFRLANKKDVNSFIDYYCTKCKLPIRLYYLSGIGGRHAEEAYEVKYVIEKRRKKMSSFQFKPYDNNFSVKD